jgi:hypothetical protein
MKPAISIASAMSRSRLGRLFLLRLFATFSSLGAARGFETAFNDAFYWLLSITIAIP